MVRPTLVYIVSDTEKSLGFEWIASHFVNISTLHFVLIGKKETPLSAYLKSIGVACEFITDEHDRLILFKVWRLYWILKKIRPSVVHCHLWRASLIGLTASFLARIKKRIFTRHHSMIHYHEHKSGRKWDQLCNWLATDIVAISQNVRDILIKFDKADPRKIHIIHHGFNLFYFTTVNDSRISNIRIKYGIHLRSPVVGVISRYLELKGIQYIIPAFRKLLEIFPTAHLILANAKGEYQKEIQKLLHHLPADCYTEIPFEDDLVALYMTFDLFVHVPIDPYREAFGQTYVEALACGIPSVFTLSGVAPEFIKHEQNALVVSFQNSEEIFEAMKRILTDSSLREKLILNGKLSANLFSLDKMTTALEKLYTQ